MIGDEKMSENIDELTTDIGKIIEEFREKAKSSLKNAGINEEDITDPSMINFLGIEKYFNEKPIKIKEVVDCLEAVSDEIIQLYNTETGEFISFPKEEFAMLDEYGLENMLNECPEWEKESYIKLNDYFTTSNDNKYVHLPTKHEVNNAQIIRDFIYELENKEIAEQLHSCINQKGMYRKFKDKLYEFGIEKQYYQYREKRLIEIAIDWCEDNCLKYEK